MPRYLYLLRHAQSADKQVGQTDKDRELTPSGMKQSIRIAGFLLDQKTFPDIVFCSTSERAKSTASLIVDALKLRADQLVLIDELYEASIRTLLRIVAQFEDNLHHVLCVAHNPGISYLAEYLTKTEVGELVPAGMAIIQLNVNSWKDVDGAEGVLINYIDPNKLTY
jgi:phosphohistidine phosphatase